MERARGLPGEQQWASVCLRRAAFWGLVCDGHSQEAAPFTCPFHCSPDTLVSAGASYALSPCVVVGSSCFCPVDCVSWEVGESAQCCLGAPGPLMALGQCQWNIFELLGSISLSPVKLCLLQLLTSSFPTLPHSPRTKWKKSASLPCDGP